jgi:hypothetical protein
MDSERLFIDAGTEVPASMDVGSKICWGEVRIGMW